MRSVKSIYPDVRQDGEHNCGDAVVAAVFQFKNRGIAPKLATEADGLHPATIESTIRRAGLCVQSGTMTVADLKHHTGLGRPVLCPIDVFGGHWVTVLKVTPKRIHYHCPVGGSQSTSHESWTELWRDSTRSGHAFDTWGIAVL